MVRDASYDTAICIEVLEHVPDPFAAVAAIARVLKPGGVVVLSVPHLSRLHEVPHDYYRYTEYGLRAMLERAGLEIVELRVKGGLFSFLGHQLSTVLLALAWTLPPLKPGLLFLNRWLVTYGCVWLDRLLATGRTFPQGYAVAAIKPDPAQPSVADGDPDSSAQSGYWERLKAHASAMPIRTDSTGRWRRSSAS